MPALQRKKSCAGPYRAANSIDRSCYQLLSLFILGSLRPSNMSILRPNHSQRSSSTSGTEWRREPTCHVGRHQNKRMRLREERWRIIRRYGGTVVDRRACNRNFGERRRPDRWLSTRSATLADRAEALSFRKSGITRGSRPGQGLAFQPAQQHRRRPPLCRTGRR